MCCNTRKVLKKKMTKRNVLTRTSVKSASMLWHYDICGKKKCVETPERCWKRKWQKEMYWQEQEMCWKTEMTNVRMQVCDKKKCVERTRNVLENNDKCESASVLWHWDICDERNVKCAEKRQCIKHAREMKWILQVCMKGKHKSVPTKYLKMKMNNMKCKKSEWLQCKNAKCGNIMKVCEEYYKPIVIRTLWQKE